MLHERLSAAIRDSGLRQNYIAQKLGMSEAILSAIINGRRKITIEEYYNLAQVLHLGMDELYNYGMC